MQGLVEKNKLCSYLLPTILSAMLLLIFFESYLLKSAIVAFHLLMEISKISHPKTKHCKALFKAFHERWQRQGALVCKRCKKFHYEYRSLWRVTIAQTARVFLNLCWGHWRWGWLMYLVSSYGRHLFSNDSINVRFMLNS